jgi:hypothetical protein
MVDCTTIETLAAADPAAAAARAFLKTKITR